MLHINYYNERSFAFEPLLEPWYLTMTMSQQNAFTKKVIKVESDKLLNINFTFGMALAVRKIKDRVLDSLK